MKTKVKLVDNDIIDYTDFYESYFEQSFSDQEIYKLLRDKVISIEELEFLRRRGLTDE